MRDPSGSGSERAPAGERRAGMAGERLESGQHQTLDGIAPQHLSGSSDLAYAATLAGSENPVSISLEATFPVKSWDRYEFLELIGQGGMGMVYKARDKRLGRTVALKFIRGDDRNLATRFLRESRAQARIEHPHICKISACGSGSDGILRGAAAVIPAVIPRSQIGRRILRCPCPARRCSRARDLSQASQKTCRFGLRRGSYPLRHPAAGAAGPPPPGPPALLAITSEFNWGAV